MGVSLEISATVVGKLHGNGLKIISDGNEIPGLKSPKRMQTTENCWKRCTRNQNFWNDSNEDLRNYFST